jgi:hypothetical protein
LTIEVTNLSTGAISRYDTKVSAGKVLNVSATAITKAIDTGKKLKKLYLIKYLKVNNEE